MSGFGSSDIVQDQSGNALANVKLNVYGALADAKAQTNLLATVTTNSLGQWPVSVNGYDMVWVRDPAGNIWSASSDTVAGDHAARLTALESATSSYELSAHAASTYQSQASLDSSVAGKISASGSAVDSALKAIYPTKTSADAKYATKAGRRVDIWDFSPDGTGGVDDSGAVQAALNAAGAGGSVYLGRGSNATGRFRCDTPITMLANQTIEGDLSSVTNTGVPTNELYFPNLTGTQVGVTLDSGCTLRNVQLRGPGSSTTVVGSSTSSTEATYDHVYWMSFGVGAQQTGTYYSRFERCSWRSCGTGLQLNGCYNVGLVVPRFACMNETTTAWGTAIHADTVRPLTIYGGSIEEYGAGGGIKITGGLSSLALFGVYWESNATTSPVGVMATSLTSFLLTALGNLVYLDGHASWVNLGSSTARIVSKGHMFSCATGSATTPTVYVMTTGSARGEIGPDEWTGVVKTGVGYDGLTAGNTPGLAILRPTGITGSDVVLQGRAVAQAQKTVTANYTATLDDYTIIGNGTSITVTLPDPLTGIAKGRRFVVKNVNSTSLTLVCSPGTRTIDGATSVTLTQWQTLTVESDFATGYLVVGKV